MPFEADIRCLPIRVELNVCYVHQMLEDLTEKEVDHDFDLSYYVLQLENEFADFVSNNLHAYNSFGDWFLDNYKEVSMFDEIVWVNDEISEEEENLTELEDSFRQVAQEMAGGLCKISVNF